MTLAIDLPPLLLVRVEARAQERGMALTEYVAKLIEEALPAEPNARAVSLLKAWAAEDATGDLAELEARRADWEATKADLNEGHSSERKKWSSRPQTCTIFRGWSTPSSGGK